MAGLLFNSAAMAQCNIKSTDRDAAHVTYYMDPELVAQTAEMGLAFSIQMVGNNYYLAATYQFAREAVPTEEKIAIELKNGYTIELDMYTMQGGNAAGVELTLAVFNLMPEQMKYLTGSELKAVHFRTRSGEKHSLVVTSNSNVLVRQLKCFGQ